jgi:hypothetical protein
MYVRARWSEAWLISVVVDLCLPCYVSRLYFCLSFFVGVLLGWNENKGGEKPVDVDVINTVMSNSVRQKTDWPSTSQMILFFFQTWIVG